MRRSVINHIEGLFNTLLQSAIEEGKNSKKSFASDLEERLRLHRPRSGHIELEVKKEKKKKKNKITKRKKAKSTITTAK